VEITEQLCRVRRLAKEYTVSFLHIPFYVEDKTIEDKLKAWGGYSHCKTKEETKSWNKHCRWHK
ncbi:hypothetical protein QQF64_033791, partial [Cirrhinus molitorella]